MKYFLGILLFVIVAVVSVLGFRGQKSTKPPVWVFPDMDIQKRYKPQGENEFFEDNRNARPVPAGTVVRGQATDMKAVFSEDFSYDVKENPSLFSGKSANGEWYKGFPIEVTHDLMEQGRVKYDIFCLPCHGQSGDGNGITKQYGMVATPSYHDDRLRNMAEGEIFNTITNGKNLMGGYGYKLNPEERWAVIAYMRALQLSQNATASDVPSEFKSELDL